MIACARNVGLSVLVYCVAILTTPVSLGEMGVSTGRDFAHNVITKIGNSHDIPESAVNDFLSSIEEIEKLPFTRVSFSEVSDWRRNKFEEAILSWVHQFPQGDYRVDAIIECHAAQYLGQIAPLFIAAPVRLDDKQRKKQFATRNEYSPSRGKAYRLPRNNTIKPC